MVGVHNRRDEARLRNDGPVAIICGGGSLPIAVAEAAIKNGRKVILFPIKGCADSGKIDNHAHHWVALGQLGRFRRLLRAESCRDIVMIGTILRPYLRDIRFDWLTLRMLPRILGLLRGGDNHLLSGICRIAEEQGFNLVGAHEIAPDILVHEGLIGRRKPSESDWDDIKRGLALLDATSPFDVGQGAVVIDNHIVAIEAAEGTDQMLERVAELRRIGRLKSRVGRGVLIKSPKRTQDRRFDLPSIGPGTVAAVARAGLAGIAVTARSTIIAEPQLVGVSADRAELFVVGLRERDGC